MGNRRVLHVHWTCAPTTGGVESHLADLAPLLARRGWGITLLTGELRPDPSADYEIVTTRALALEEIRTRSQPLPALVGQLTATIKEILERRNIKVIHGHNLHHFSPAPAMAIERLRKELGLAVHHTFHETWPDIICDLSVYRDWNANYAISEFVRRQCQELLGLEPAVLHLGIDTHRFFARRAPLTGEPPYILLHPARLLPWKGVHVSIRALRTVLDKGFDVRLALTDTQQIADWSVELPDYRRNLLRLIKELDLDKHVDLVRTAYADMPSVYERSDIVLYPTIQGEPLGLVPIEAMSCSRPIVASRCGGITETVVDGVTGFLVAPNDADKLSQRIIWLLEHPAEASSFGRAGRSRVEACFDLNNFASALEDAYERPTLD